MAGGCFGFKEELYCRISTTVSRRRKICQYLHAWWIVMTQYQWMYWWESKKMVTQNISLYTLLAWPVICAVVRSTDVIWLVWQPASRVVSSRYSTQFISFNAVSSRMVSMGRPVRVVRRNSLPVRLSIPFTVGCSCRMSAWWAWKAVYFSSDEP